MARLILENPSEFDFLIDVELESVCECGHRNPEHSASGQCHGCRCCDDDTTGDTTGVTTDDDHAYARCVCVQFQLAVEAGTTPSVTLAR